MNSQELIRRRLERGWSQTQLAKAAGLTQSRLKAYESDLIRMGSEVGHRLALALARPVAPKRWQGLPQEAPWIHLRQPQSEGQLCRQLQLRGAHLGFSSPLERGFVSHFLLDNRGRPLGIQSIPCLSLPDWTLWPEVVLVQDGQQAPLDALICRKGRWYALRIQRNCQERALVLGLPLLWLDPAQIPSQQLLCLLLVPREENPTRRTS